jgi:hypothetical protein
MRSIGLLVILGLIEGAGSTTVVDRAAAHCSHVSSAPAADTRRATESCHRAGALARGAQRPRAFGHGPIPHPPCGCGCGMATNKCGEYCAREM